QQPSDLVNTFFLRGPGLSGPRDPFAPPEQEKGYPEPSMFGLLPASGLYVRHAQRLAFRDVDFGFIMEDARPAVVLDEVRGVESDPLNAPPTAGVPLSVLRGGKEFPARDCPGLADTNRPTAETESL